ncbi:hypothetical protein [Sediminibacterium goheungense]|uniref:Uncharacterized protein n=1 Tax=Sediminibacterium goheungense TaxID=1086393 RepID=A0A4V3C4L7_9BACT|nr:hypothetical protein [Sediminibacterium goheungense]TDO26468.1 hypothetical protein BC659_1774 [Sediminibacterium goheungense]
MKKLLFRLIFVVVLILSIVYLMAWKSPRYYIPQNAYNTADSIVPFLQYTGEHERPFLVETKTAIVFGATHTKDRKDPQLIQMENLWSEFKPTIALVEGRLGFLLPPFMDPVQELGEGGMLKALAHRDGVKIMNWDLSKKALADSLQLYFTREQIALQQILNPYFGNLRFGKPSSPDGFIEEYIKRAAYVGLEDSIKTVADIDRIWVKYFPAGPDWRETSDEYALPGYLAKLMATSNDIRNRQLVASIKELVKKGERIFIVCGSSHAYCIAPAFK